MASSKLTTPHTTNLFFNSVQVRMILNNEEPTGPLFCLADVCKALNLESVNKTANQIKDEFGRGELNSGLVLDANNHRQTATFITEPQLYFVMMRSRAKVAREFRQWVVNEVLPSIRRYGSYRREKTIPQVQNDYGFTEDRARQTLMFLENIQEKRAIAKDQIRALRSLGANDLYTLLDSILEGIMVVNMTIAPCCRARIGR